MDPGLWDWGAAEDVHHCAVIFSLAILVSFLFRLMLLDITLCYIGAHRVGHISGYTVHLG